MAVFKRWNGTSWEVIGPTISNSRINTVEELIAPEYDSNSAYSVGDFVVYSDTLYKCNTEIGSGGELWNSAHWTETKIGDEVSDLKSALTDNNNLLTENIHNLYEKTNLVYRYTQFDKGGFSATTGEWGSSSNALSEKGLTTDNLSGYIILPSNEVHLSVKTGYRVRTYIYSSDDVSSFVEYVNWQTGEVAHAKW